MSSLYEDIVKLGNDIRKSIGFREEMIEQYDNNMVDKELAEMKYCKSLNWELSLLEKGGISALEGVEKKIIEILHKEMNRKEERIC